MNNNVIGLEKLKVYIENLSESDLLLMDELMVMDELEEDLNVQD